jgi:integrase
MMGIHGQGNITPIREKRKDGSIRERWRVSLMVEGRRTWRIARSPEEAERIRRALVDAAQRDLDPTRQTVEGYLRSWIASQRKGKRIRERTLIGYERIIDQRIIPALGKLTLDRLSKRRIQAWIDGQSGSPQTVRNAHAVLRKALGSAAGDVIPSNPAVGVELPRRRTFEGRPLTPDEAHRLLDATKDDRLHALWRLAIVTGLREGELLGLSRDALEDDTLRVETQLQRINGRWVLSPTKAARGLTTLTLDRATVRLLQSHLRKMADERKPRWRYFGLMFPSPQGEPYHQSTILEEWGRACDKAGIARRRFHDIRHSTSAFLKAAGIPEDVRMARLGHNTTRMARHYGGAASEADREAVERLAEVIG